MLTKKFSLGKVSVYELATAQKERNDAMQRYYSAIKDSYESFFTLRNLALYDFKNVELEKYSSMISDTTIRKLVDYISLNACSVNSSGLYNGKSGISLALFETAKCLQDTEIEDKAFSLFQESLIRKTNDYGFENGMSGIGYVLIYLITNKLIDADFEDLFGDQREAIIKHFENIDKQPDKLLVSYKIIYFYLSWINYKSKMREYIQLLRKYFKDWNFIYHFSFSIGKIFIT